MAIWESVTVPRLLFLMCGEVGLISIKQFLFRMSSSTWCVIGQRWGYRDKDAKPLEAFLEIMRMTYECLRRGKFKLGGLDIGSERDNGGVRGAYGKGIYMVCSRLVSYKSLTSHSKV